MSVEEEAQRARAARRRLLRRQYQRDRFVSWLGAAAACLLAFTCGWVLRGDEDPSVTVVCCIGDGPGITTPTTTEPAPARIEP